MTLFTVDQRQHAIVFRLGEVGGRDQTEPGLYFKVPLLAERALLRHAHPDPRHAGAERFITAEKKNVLVDSFVKWRIVDVRQYYISVGGDEAARRDRGSRRRSTTRCARSSASAPCTRWSPASATRSWT